MKNSRFSIFIHTHRIKILTALLWGVVGNSSLFTLHSSLLHAQNVQEGKASFYSKRATGSRTANGERLHHDSLTCAHKTLPFGTMLKVTHVENGRSVIVRVNDRGPFVRGRVIDLSWGAARELGMISQGIATVIVEPADKITIPLRPIEKKYTLPMLMVGSSLNKDSIVPVWQEKLQIDHKKMQHHMNNTAQKSLWERFSNYLNE